MKMANKKREEKKKGNNVNKTKDCIVSHR